MRATRMRLGCAAAVLSLASCALGPAPATPTPTPGSGDTVHPTLSGAARTPTPSATAARSTAAKPAPPSPTGQLNKAEWQSDLNSWREQMNVPGVMVGIWTPTDSWVGASGDACPGAGPLTAKHHVRIGSVTKTFTATAILALADQGKLDLDKRVDAFVGSVPNGDATIRQVATMRSGILDYTSMEDFDAAVNRDPGREWSTAELLDFVRRAGSFAKPGEVFNYSNSNYVVLGAVLEKVTGKSWSDAVHDLVEKPVRLSQTSYAGATGLPEPFACGVSDFYEPKAPEDATRRSPSVLGAAGGLTSTMDDLHRWAEALATTNPALKPATQKARLDSLRQGDGPSPYGFGFDTDRGYIGHNGEVPGYTTVLRYNPDKKIAIVVVVTSNAYFEGARPAHVVFDAVLRGLG